MKYLGLHLDRRLTWRTHLKYVNRYLASIKQRLSKLAPLLLSESMTRRLWKLIVSTYVLPVATYAIPVWGYLVRTHRLSLQGQVDRGLRWATKAHYLTSNRTIRTALGVRSLNGTIQTLSRKFYRRAARFEGNPLISGLGDTSPRYVIHGIDLG